jgi:PAS domain-containing protein
MAYECGIETLEDLVTSSGFRLIFRQSGDPMALLDPVTGRILDANPALRVALGEREIDPLIGRLGDSFSRSSATASPTDGPFAIALRSLETEGSVRFEWEASTVSGAPVCFES